MIFTFSGIPALSHRRFSVDPSKSNLVLFNEFKQLSLTMLIIKRLFKISSTNLSIFGVTWHVRPPTATKPCFQTMIKGPTRSFYAKERTAFLQPFPDTFRFAFPEATYTTLNILAICLHIGICCIHVRFYFCFQQIQL